MPANLGGFSIFAGSWGTWLSAVWLSVSLYKSVCVCEWYVHVCVCVCKVHPGGYISSRSVSSDKMPALPLTVRSCLSLHQTQTHTREEQIQTNRKRAIKCTAWNHCGMCIDCACVSTLEVSCHESLSWEPANMNTWVRFAGFIFPSCLILCLQQHWI